MTLVEAHEEGAPLPCCVRNGAKECTMTDHAVVWRLRRQVMLEAARLGNVSEACRRAGDRSNSSRQQPTTAELGLDRPGMSE